MRIDYIVDTYSRNYPVSQNTNDQKKQVKTTTQKPAEKTQVNSHIKNIYKPHFPNPNTTHHLHRMNRQLV